MSLEQIKREFPFLMLQALPTNETSPNVKVDVRVSRLSMDAMCLPMQSVIRKDYCIHYEMFVCDARGEAVQVAGNDVGALLRQTGTFGDSLSHDLWPDGEDIAGEVCYIVYTADTSTAVWRRRKGTMRSHREMVTQRYESIIFKMPKKITLWQLLRRYRQGKRALVRQ